MPKFLVDLALGLISVATTTAATIYVASTITSMDTIATITRVGADVGRVVREVVCRRREVVVRGMLLLPCLKDGKVRVEVVMVDVPLKMVSESMRGLYSGPKPTRMQPMISSSDSRCPTMAM